MLEEDIDEQSKILAEKIRKEVDNRVIERIVKIHDESKFFRVPDDLDTFEKFDAWLTSKIEEDNESSTDN